MPSAHPIELRERLVEAYRCGEGGYLVLSRRFCVGEATAKRWVWQYQRDGKVVIQKKRGGTPTTIERADLEEILARHRDANAGEITAAYNRTRRGRQRRHLSSIKRALRREGYVVKKNGYVQSNNSDQMSSLSGSNIGARFEK